MAAPEIGIQLQLDIKESAAAEHNEDFKKESVAFDEHDVKEPATPEEATAERTFIRKIDFIILPLLIVMYFLASLDRGDIANAAVAGMNTELHLTAKMYSNCVSFYYVGYVVFQLPATVFLRKITPPIQLGIALIGWGTSTSLLSVAPNYGTIAGLRVCIGVFEAFLQAGPLYLTFYYTRKQLATRGAIFFSMMAIAGSMNGVIAYGIQRNLNHARGWLAWRWLFLIEGLLSVFFGFVVLGLLPPVPERIKYFFNTEEKEIAIRRSKQAFNVPNAKVRPAQLSAVLKDPKCYFYAFIYSCMNINLSCFSGFLPVILRSFGYGSLQTQLLTIPVYVCTGLSIVFWGALSDRLQKRCVPLMICFSIAAAGWIILLASKSQHLSFAGTFLIGMGTFPTVVLIQTWMNCTILGFTKRAGALAFIMTFGQCCAIGGTQAYSDAPLYRRGNSIALGTSLLGVIGAFCCRLYLQQQNKRKIAEQYSDRSAELRVLSIEDIFDNHPDFFYQL